MHEELGMYWKDNRRDITGMKRPETQSLLIEAFKKITQDMKSVNDMKLWLLKQKQTQHWGNTKATADACYALLLQGTEQLNNQPKVTIQMGAQQFSSADDEAGWDISAHDRRPATYDRNGHIQVKLSASGTDAQQNASWGAVWQHFEDIDRVMPLPKAKRPAAQKQLSGKNTDRAQCWPVRAIIVKKTGDKIK